MPTGSEKPYRINRFRGEFAVVWFKDGKRRRHTLGTVDPREAERLAPAVYAEYNPRPSETVKHLWDAYTQDMEGRAVVATMKHTWKALEPRFGSKKPSQINITECRAHVADRRAVGIKDGTIHTEMGHLRMVLLWAVKQEMLAAAPYIERPSKPKSKTSHLTKQECKRLMDAATETHLRFFVVLALTTGGRSGAILDLTWDRVHFDSKKVDLENPEITVPHKGRAIVPMNDKLERTLREAKAGAFTDYVIEYGGKKVGSVKRSLATSAENAGLPKVSPHMLRHSAAVHMAEDGVPMEEIAQYLGHSDVEVTRRIYARFSPNYLRGAAKSLEYD